MPCLKHATTRRVLLTLTLTPFAKALVIFPSTYTCAHTHMHIVCTQCTYIFTHVKAHMYAVPVCTHSLTHTHLSVMYRTGC